MKRLLRALGAIVLVPALLVTFPAASASAAPVGAAANGGFSEIAGCISGADHLLVSVVVDESLSLRSTDPSALRVQGITTAIDSLEQLTATVGDETSVEVSLSTFARSYDTLVDWRALDTQSAQELRSVAIRQLPARDAGDATDYRQALLGAKQQLDARQRQLEDPAVCKLLLWFTDGALDVDAQTDTAHRELCQAGGIADAVRDDGIAVVALALFTPGAGVTSPQRDQLRAVAEGRGSQATCGTTPIPSDSATGVYLPADDPSALQRLFAGAGALVAGGTEVDTISCPGADCPGGAYRLDIDRGIAGARVLVQSTDPRVDVTSPSGRRLKLSSGQAQEVEGATVSYLVRDQLATLNLTFEPYADSRGRWIIRPQGRSELGVYWFWGAQLALVSSEIRAGARNEIALQLQDQNGNPLPASLYRRARLSVDVGNREIEARVAPDGRVHGTADLGVDDLPANMLVSASLSMRTDPGNVLLGPISLSGRIPVALPPSYPSISPKELDFGHLEGLGTATASLQLTGSQLGASQVCVAGSRVTVPGQASRESLIKTDSECVSLDAEERKTLDLELTPGASADGVASGEIRLRMTAADGSEDVDLVVPLRLEMARQVDEGTRWAMIAALLGLALLFPLLLLVGSNLLLARFVMTSTSRTAAKPVKVSRSGLHPLHGHALLEPEDFQNAAFSGVRKGGRMTLDGTGITLQARRIFSLREPEGLAAGPSGKRLVSSLTPYTSKTINEAPTALSEVDAAFVILDAAGATPDEATGTLVMVVPGDVDRRGIQDRAARMSSVPDWEKLLAQLTGSGHSRSTGGGSPSGDRQEQLDDGEVSAKTAAQDDVPPLWDWATDSTESTPTPAKTSLKRRFRGSRKPRQAPPRDPSASPASDDDLPPLPDFLK